EANATTFPNPPAAPSNLSASISSNTQINLSWSDNSSDESGFKIERKTGINGTYSQIAIVGAGVNTYNDPGLNINTRYFYRVRATNAGGDSAFSNEADATTTLIIISGAIAGGESHSLAVKDDGTVWSWGLNSSGQLGIGSITNYPFPLQ